MAIDNLKENKAGLSDFDNGRMMAFYEVLSTAKEQAETLGYRFDNEELNQVDPEKLLMNNKWF